MRKSSEGSYPLIIAGKSGPPRVLDVTVVLIDGDHPSTAIAPIEVFNSAGQLWNALHGRAVQPRFRVRVASVDGAEVNSVCSLKLQPECGITNISHTDIIIVPASGLNVQDRIARSSDLLAWLKRWHSRGAYIAAICTGVAFLGECGLLDGRKATTHWALADILRERYPGARWQPEQFVTEDGRILCSGGVYASIDISLYLVEKFCGHEVALQCAKSLLLSMPRSRQSGYAVVPLARPHFDGKVREVEEYLHESFATEVSIDTLAERIGMSSRTFIRRFKAATGHMPGAYVQSLRVAAAKELLEQGGRSVQTIASKIGYDDIAFFRKVFKRHTGMTPTEYRDCFGSLAFRREEVAHEGPVVAASGQA